MKYFKNVLLLFSEKDLFTPHTYVIIENMFSLVIQLRMLQLMQHSLSIDQQISKKTVRSLAQLYFFFSFYSIVILRLVLYIGEPYGLF